MLYFYAQYYSKECDQVQIVLIRNPEIIHKG